jgi:hypothetical protein
MFDELAFPGFILSLKQGEENADTGFFCRKLLDDLDRPFYLLEAPFNDVGGL